MTVQGQEGLRRAELQSDFLRIPSPDVETEAGGGRRVSGADKQLKNQVSHVAASFSAQALQFWSRGEEDDTTSPLCFHPPEATTGYLLHLHSLITPSCHNYTSILRVFVGRQQHL